MIMSQYTTYENLPNVLYLSFYDVCKQEEIMIRNLELSMEASFLKNLKRQRGDGALSLIHQKHIYIRQSNDNTKRIIILSLTFANSAGFPEMLTINSRIGEFLKTSKKTNELQARSKRFIRNHQTKVIKESEMNWNAFMTLTLMISVYYSFAVNFILNQLSSTLITDV